MTIFVKLPHELEAMKVSGELSARVLREVGKRCQPGVSTWELDLFAEEYIRDNGGTPTFKGYGGYPASLCASVNDEVIHGIPSKDKVLKSGDIISIDIGATVDGWAGDNAWTFAVGNVAPEVKRLLEATEKSLWAGIEAARAGNTTGDIGHAVQQVAEAADMSVVREYVGHGIGRDMHEEPDVPNYGRKHRGAMLVPGMVIAIEPMVCLGRRRLKAGGDGWLVRTRDGKPAAHFEKTVAITEDGAAVLISVEPDHVRPL